MLLLAVVLSSGAHAQQPVSPTASQGWILAPGQTVSNLGTRANSVNNDSERQSPETGILPGALRQRADNRFLAQRGIGWESRVSANERSSGEAEARIGAPAESLRLARAQHLALVRKAALSPTFASPGTWQSVGPAQVATAAYGAVTGRITSLAADPNDTTGNTLYLGSTGGGVWKSGNAAGSSTSVTFAPLTDVLPAFSNTLGSLSIGAITVQPTSSGVVLAGTGDPNDALDSYYGVGILRSTDGGLTWQLIGGSKDALLGGLQNYSFAGNGFAGFAWSSISPSLVVAAVAQSVEGILVNAGSEQNMKAGLYYSSDAGQTWYLAVIEDDTGHIVQSPHVAGSPPGNSVTSVLWNPVRKRFYAAVRFHGYYESLDGITWTRLVNQPGSGLSAQACPTNAGTTGQTSCPIFRGALAVQPVTGDMFALTTDLSNLDQGLFQDVCSPTHLAVTSCASSTVAFGTQIASGALENGTADPTIPATTIPLADYDLTLSAVASQQDTILFAGTEDIYRCSLAGSCAWRNTTNIQTCAAAQVAPSQHATESTFGSSGLIYFANDGGLWRSTDTVAQTGSACATTDANHYQNLNSGIGSLAEIEHFSVSPASSDVLLAGMGGFGTVGTTTGQGAWQQLLTGEGSYTAIDPAEIQNWYTEAGSGVDILRCTGGTSCTAAGFGTVPVIGSGQISGDADYFTDPAPWILDPLNSADVLLGSCRVWRGPATGGSSWSASNLLSPMLDGNQQPVCTGNAQLRSINAGLDASAPSGSEQMYAGMAGPYDGGGLTPGHIFTSTVPAAGGQTTWIDRWHSPVTNSSNNPQFNEGGFAISSIAVDPHDASGQTVYVTTQGFSGNGISEGEVYGSTDGGAHWLNLTNSLPLAPANSIVVDPNVPSILYVALDTGVYYTQNLAACSDQAQTCWAVYGAGLPNAPVTSLQVFSAGGLSILEASTYGRGIWALKLLTAPAQGTLSPPSGAFANQQIGTAGAAVPFTLVNTGSTLLAIAGIQVSPNYVQTNNCGLSVAVAARCTIQVTFTPAVAGDSPGTLTVYANVGGGRLSSTLDGTGLVPGMLSLTPSSLSFPATAQGGSSSAQGVTVENTGGVAVQLQSLAVSTDYLIGANSCSGTLLAPGSSCSVGIAFTPVASAIGPRPGQLSIPNNLPSTPAVVSLSGVAVTPPALTLSPTSLTFPDTGQGAVSAPQSITVTNPGGSAAQLQAPTVTSDYQIPSSTCGAVLAPGASCALQIVFAPSATGNRAGLLTIPANVPGGAATAALDGTGIGPPPTTGALTFSPLSLSFGSAVAGTTAVAQSMTVTNSGVLGVLLGSAGIAGDYALSAGGTCHAGLTLTPAPAAGDSCTLQIAFSPTGPGDRPGLLTLPGNIPGGFATALLDGTGVLPGVLSLSTSLLTFNPTTIGSASAAQSVTLTNTGGSYLLLQLPLISSEYQVATNTCGSILDVGRLCTLGIVFHPTAAGDQPGVLTVSASGGAIHAQATLDGSGVAAAALVFTPTALAFASTQDGKTSAQQGATLSNTGGVTAQLLVPVVTGDYSIATNSCGATLASSATCLIQMAFSPTAAGSRTGSLTVSTVNGASSASVSLSGTGTPAPSLVLTPTALVFAATVQGATTAAQNITVANIGSGLVNLRPFAITGDFAISADTCSGTPLSPTYSCTLSIIFGPSTAGLRTGLLTVSNGAETHTATLTGIGLGAATDTLSPTSLTFGPQLFGTVSPIQSVTLTNSGGSTLGSILTAVTGPFIAANTCGTILGGDLTCSIAVSFAPTGAGAQIGQLIVTDAQRSQIITLNGLGILPSSTGPSAVATPASLSFGGFAVGVTAPVQLVTMTNNGTSSLDGFTAATGTSSFAVTTDSCGETIAAGSNCTLGVSFTPAQPGNLVDQLTLGSPSLKGPLTIALSGAGEDFQLSVSGPSSDLITNGQTATYQLVVTPVGSSAGSLTFTCSGAPVNSSCTINPATLSVSGGATGSATVSIVTGLPPIALQPPLGRGLPWRSAAVLALLLPCLLLRGSTRRTFLALLVTAVLVFAPLACGVHASGGSAGATGGSLGKGTTPPGQYPVTVTASFPGAQRSVSLTLTVE